jgi:Protein of unknown function (DUF4238)
VVRQTQGSDACTQAFGRLTSMAEIVPPISIGRTIDYNIQSVRNQAGKGRSFRRAVKWREEAMGIQGTKKRHHYVPQFYMRNFSSHINKHIINICVVKSGIHKQDVPIRDQCYKWRLYGNTDEIENKLAHLESLCSAVINRIVSASRMPTDSVDAMARLYCFTAIQLLRTIGEAERLTEGYSKVNSRLHDKYPGLKIDPSFGDDNGKILTTMVLQEWGEVADYISDLKIRLIINKTGTKFITSDDPVIKYNQYCEGIKGISNVGCLTQGLEIFMPISPTHMIMLYDSAVYSVEGKDDPVIVTKDTSDVERLNLLQAIRAEKIILFSSWNDLHHVIETLKRAKKYRKPVRAEVQEFRGEETPNKSLMIIHTSNLNVGLKLSFISIKRRSRRLNDHDRIMLFRDRSPTGREFNRMRQSKSGSGQSQRFIRDVKKHN